MAQPTAVVQGTAVTGQLTGSHVAPAKITKPLPTIPPKGALGAMQQSVTTTQPKTLNATPAPAQAQKVSAIAPPKPPQPQPQTKAVEASQAAAARATQVQSSVSNAKQPQPQVPAQPVKTGSQTTSTPSTTAQTTAKAQKGVVTKAQPKNQKPGVTQTEKTIKGAQANNAEEARLKKAAEEDPLNKEKRVALHKYYLRTATDLTEEAQEKKCRKPLIDGEAAARNAGDVGLQAFFLACVGEHLVNNLPASAENLNLASQFYFWAAGADKAKQKEYVKLGNELIYKRKEIFGV